MWALTGSERRALTFVVLSTLIGVGIQMCINTRAMPVPLLPFDDTVGKLNINTASKAELAELPGIGPALAERILNYRAAHGEFSDVSELQQVKGIGGSCIEKIRRHAYAR
jgi:competence ComEA-like helix-hairpin-helix protein